MFLAVFAVKDSKICPMTANNPINKSTSYEPTTSEQSKYQYNTV